MRRRPALLVLLLATALPASGTGDGADAPDAAAPPETAVPVAAAEPLAGRWRAVEDPAEGTVSILRLSVENGELVGHVERLLDARGQPLERRCEGCPGALAGQPIAGMRFMWGLRKDGARWVDGQAMDLRPGATQGTVARCELALVDGAAVLHAWIGVKLLGQTRTWTREP